MKKVTTTTKIRYTLHSTFIQKFSILQRFQICLTPCSPCIIENKFHRDYAFNNSAITFQRYMDIAAKAAAYAAYNQPSYNYSSYSGQDESYSSGYGSVSGQEYDDSYSYSSTDYSYKGHTIEAPPTQYSTAPPTNSGYEQLHPPGTSTMERPPYPVCTQYQYSYFKHLFRIFINRSYRSLQELSFHQSRYNVL